MTEIILEPINYLHNKCELDNNFPTQYILFGKTIVHQYVDSQKFGSALMFKRKIR